MTPVVVVHECLLHFVQRNAHIPHAQPPRGGEVAIVIVYLHELEQMYMHLKASAVTAVCRTLHDVRAVNCAVWSRILTCFSLALSVDDLG